MLLVAGMIPMSTAITVSGAGDEVAKILVGAVGGPGGYRFGDYWKLGLSMIGLFFFVVSVGWFRWSGSSEITNDEAGRQVITQRHKTSSKGLLGGITARCSCAVAGER